MQSTTAAAIRKGGQVQSFLPMTANISMMATMCPSKSTRVCPNPVFAPEEPYGATDKVDGRRKNEEDQ